MEKSPEIKDLAEALVTFTLKMKTVAFDSDNPFFKSKYASLTTLVENARVELANCGLAISQLTEGDGGITTILMHRSGQFISSTLTLKPVKDDPQGRGSAITYSRRYAYAAILGLVSDQDDDGNHATGLNGKKEKEEKEVKPQSTKDRLVLMAQAKFADPDKFKAWRVENNLVENLEKATPTELTYVEAVLREYKPLNRIASKA